MRPELLTRLPGRTSCKFYRKFDVNSRLPWRAPTSTLLVGIWRKVCQRVCRQCVPNCILNNNLHSLLSLSLVQSLAIIWQLSYLHKEVNQLRGWSWWPSSVSCVPVLAEQWPVVSLRFGLVLASWSWRPPSTHSRLYAQLQSSSDTTEMVDWQEDNHTTDTVHWAVNQLHTFYKDDFQFQKNEKYYYCKLVGGCCMYTVVCTRWRPSIKVRQNLLFSTLKIFEPKQDSDSDRRLSEREIGRNECISESREK